PQRTIKTAHRTRERSAQISDCSCPKPNAPSLESPVPSVRSRSFAASFGEARQGAGSATATSPQPRATTLSNLSSPSNPSNPSTLSNLHSRRRKAAVDGGPAAVGEKHCTSDEARGIGGEEQRRAHHFLCSRPALQ